MAIELRQLKKTSQLELHGVISRTENGASPTSPEHDRLHGMWIDQGRVHALNPSANVYMDSRADQDVDEVAVLEITHVGEQEFRSIVATEQAVDIDTLEAALESLSSLATRLGGALEASDVNHEYAHFTAVQNPLGSFTYIGWHPSSSSRWQCRR